MNTLQKPFHIGMLQLCSLFLQRPPSVKIYHYEEMSHAHWDYCLKVHVGCLGPVIVLLMGRRLDQEQAKL